MDFKIWTLRNHNRITQFKFPLETGEIISFFDI